METGLPTREVFDIVVCIKIQGFHHLLFWLESGISHFWRSNFYDSNEDKANLHQPSPCTVIQLQCWNNSKYCNYFYSCFAFYFISRYMYHDIPSVPPRDKNKLFAPSSFSQFTSCRMVIDCTDIEVATPSLMSQQNATYSSYRSMNSFKGHCRSGTKCSYQMQCKQVVPWCNFW